MSITLPPAKSTLVNPTQEELRELVARMPNAVRTEFDNYNVTTAVTARSAGSTFLVTDDPDSTQVQTMSREEYERNVRRQEAHIAQSDMILVEGYIGPETSPMRRAARVYIEAGNANIPAMQQQLYFPKDADWREEDALTVIYTPNCPAEGYPDDRLVTIDLENEVTRVFNIDYFGESKMGGLRMWMDWVYGQGALAMHSGAKVIPTDQGDKVALIVGLSGTGKTTTTFRQQNNSLPVQDDIVALVAGGGVHSTENGCFAKTIGLDPDDEPTIYGALTRPDAWLENVAVDEHGKVDFHDDSYTANGRGTFELSVIEHYDPRKLGKADFLLILNRNESIIPAVAKMTSPEQAAAYFMLGETKGTSAGGAAEAGKFLRVPGTNPFFMRFDYMQGNRLVEMIASMDYDFGVYLMSTGMVGGGPDVEGSKKIRIPHSSAIVKAIAEGTIEWEEDPDFGYLVASSVPGIDDLEILQPRRLYERLGRADEYRRRLAGERYTDILKAGGGILSTVRATRAASEEDLVRRCAGRLARMRARGVTTVEVKSGYGLDVATEVKLLVAARRAGEQAGVRVLTTFLGAHTVPAEHRVDRGRYVDEVIEAQLPAVAGLADFIDVYVDDGAFTVEEGRRILAAGRARGLVPRVHAEQVAFTGAAAMAAGLGATSADHLEQIDAAGIAAMARAGTVAVLLPGAMIYLKDPPPPVAALREAGVPLAVATDLNPGTSPVDDLWVCASLACVTMGLTVEEALLGITANAARALGRSDLGRLVPGAIGDLVLVRPPPGEPVTVDPLIQFLSAPEVALLVQDGVVTTPSRSA